jgi:type II secretory pathway component GspD/PulD (secretin)/tetratricopeptide (TPR) repeat protein
MADVKTDPSSLLASGQDAMVKAQDTRATGFFKAVLKHPKASEAQKEQASTALAQIRRKTNPELSEAQTKIAQATAAIHEGDLDGAEKLLLSVKNSKLDLGWFENERIAKQLDLIKQIRSGKVPAIAKDPLAGGASSDALAQAKQLYAQEKMVEARQASRDGNYRLAVEAYEKILKIDPDNVQAKEGLATAQLKANQRMMPRNVLQNDMQQIRLREAATVAEYKELYNKADSLREQGNFTAAAEAVQQAKVTLDRNQNSLSASRYSQLRESATTLGVQIREEQQLAESTLKQKLEEQRMQDAQSRRTTALVERDQQVQDLLKRAVDLRREQKYERAIELLKQAHFLDPNNPAVSLLQETMEDTLSYIKVRDLARKRGMLMAHNSVENYEATLPYNELMTFPADWPELTFRRRQTTAGDTAGTSEINRQVNIRLHEPIDVDFDAHKLETSIAHIRESTNVNFVVNWTAMTNVGVEPDMPITLKIKNVPASQALKLVLEQASATNELDPVSYAVKDGIVEISTLRDLKRRTAFLRSYDIRDLLVQVPNFNNSPQFDLGSALESGGSVGGGSGGGGGGGGGSDVNLFGDSDNSDDEEQTGTEARLQRVTEILELIRTQTGTQQDWVEFGGDVSSVRELNGLLLVRTTPGTHDEITTLLDELRQTRSMQISVEARFLLVDQNFLEEIGVDVDLQINDNGSGTGWSSTKIAQDSFGITSRPFSTGIPGSFGSAGAAIGAIEDFVAGTGFSGTGRALDVGFSYVDDWSVNVMIRATQNQRRAISLTAPRITFFNGQQAYVTVARQIAFISDLEPVPDANGMNPTLSFTQSGVVLAVEGTISADRRYVTMTVQPSLATISEIRRVEFLVAIDSTTTTGTTTTTAPTIATGAIEAPQLELTQLETTVSVPDQGTLMLGGQRLVGEIEVESGVPVLSKIPLVNRLFTNRTKAKDERTLLILIKPTIIIQQEEENQLFPGLESNPEQYNIGNRLR